MFPSLNDFVSEDANLQIYTDFYMATGIRTLLFFYDEGKFPVVNFFLIQVKNNVLSPSSIGNRAVSSVILKMFVP